MKQRRAACRAARAVVRHRDVLNAHEELKEITDVVLKNAIDAITGGATLDAALSSAPPILGKILSKVKIVGGSVPGSAHSRGRMLHDINSMMHTLGPPVLFVTINPNDFTSAHIMHWSTGLGSVDEQVPEFIRALDCMRIVAENPQHALRYFEETSQQFEDIVLGAKRPGRKGVFGALAGFYGVPETQGRGTLHIHYVVWILGSGTSDGILHRCKEDEDFKTRFENYCDSIMTSSFRAASDVSEDEALHAEVPTAVNAESGEINSSSDGGPVSVQSVVEVAATVVEEAPVAQDKSLRVTSHRPPNLQVPFNSSTAVDFKNDLLTDAELVAKECNMHKPKHTFTCFKGGRSTCRFGFPKLHVPATVFDLNLGGTETKRNHSFLNTFNPLIASSLRCNHDVK